jgi:hypothetical protein
MEEGPRLGANGALLVGEKGVIMHGSHGAGGLTLLPRSLRESYTQPAESIPRVPSGKGAHEQDWVRACKDGKPASSSFDYGGPLTEMALLGMVAIRVPDQLLTWDSAALRITNNRAAQAMVKPDYRDGWAL